MKVILLGDSIRMGYQPLVAQKLGDRGQVWGPEENGGDSRNLLAHLEAWAFRSEADVIHFNCGLHDLRSESIEGPIRQAHDPDLREGPDNAYQVPIDEYVRNLKTIIQRLKEETEARLIWASTTPVDDELHARRDVGFVRKTSDVVAYNRAAGEVVGEAGLEVNDLYEVIQRAGVSACLHTDGVHMSPLGYDLLARAVVKAVAR